MKFFIVALMIQLNSNVYAQTVTAPATHADRPSPTPQPAADAPQGDRPVSIQFGNASGAGNLVSALLSRFHSLGIGALIADQRNNGIHEKSYVATFDASGAFIYESDLGGSSSLVNHETTTIEDYDETGKNVGVQIIPFTVSLAPGGSIYLSFDAWAFRNMNALQNSKNRWDDDGGFQFFDNMDFFVFKFDQGYSFTNINSRRIEIYSFDGKVDLLNSRVGTRYLAVKIGASLSGDSETIYTPDGKPNYFGADLFPDQSKGLHPGYNFMTTMFPGNLGAKYGLEFNNETRHGFKIRLQALFNTRWIHGDAIDNVHYAQYYAAIQTGSPIPDRRIVSYKHVSNYFNPNLEVSQRVSKQGSNPVYLGVGASGNIPISDVISTDGSFGQMNLAPYNNELVKVKLFVHF